MLAINHCRKGDHFAVKDISLIVHSGLHVSFRLGQRLLHSKQLWLTDLVHVNKLAVDEQNKAFTLSSRPIEITVVGNRNKRGMRESVLAFPKHDNKNIEPNQIWLIRVQPIQNFLQEQLNR